MVGVTEAAGLNANLYQAVGQSIASQQGLGQVEAQAMGIQVMNDSMSAPAFTVDIGNSTTEMGTYNASGQVGPQVVNATLGAMHSGVYSGNTQGAYQNSYNTSQNVLGAYFG
ncbi:MAG: hypothetical protein K8S56_03215 [Candidatus Cloacimonetes bacterium]|nr:hypothetical protein [Candidatus Cloacimonadota bacterium]